MDCIFLKKRFFTSVVALSALCLIWSRTASGEHLQMGGGQPLDLSSLTMVHQESFEDGQTPQTVFWGGLDIGQKENDPWTGMLAKGAYVLMHQGRPGAVRYYFRHSLDQPAGAALATYALSVDVAGEFSGDLSGAGLIYAYDPLTKYYFGFVKGAGRAYAIYRRDKQGLRRLVGGTSNAVEPEKACRLAIVPQDAAIHFYINGTHIAALEDEGAMTGGAGLIAISPGMFAFDNFTLYQPGRPSTGRLDSNPAGQIQIPSGTPQGAPRSASRLEEPPATAPPVRDGSVQPGSESLQERLASYKQRLTVGMTKQRVVQLFGDPSFVRGARLFYEFDEKDAPGEMRTLVIQLDESGRVLDFQML